MKKIFTLFLISVMSLSAAAAQPARMYLIGDATAGGWSLDDASLMMTVSDGVYEWVGNLNGGELKFVIQNNWIPSYGPAANGDSLRIGTVNLAVRNVEEEGNDNKFRVAAGRWSLHIDLTGENPQMTVADGTSLPDKGFVGHFPVAVYAIGTATTIGWDKDNAIELPETDFNSGIYAGELTLQTSGELKFLKQKDWGKAFGATVANAPLTGEGEYNIMTVDDSNDLKFSVSLAAATTYNITIDATTGKMTVAAKHESALENVMLNGAVEVYDIQGRYVAASMADLPAGMYIVRSAAGTQKIIIY